MQALPKTDFDTITMVFRSFHQFEFSDFGIWSWDEQLAVQCQRIDNLCLFIEVDEHGIPVPLGLHHVIQASEMGNQQLIHPIVSLFKSYFIKKQYDRQMFLGE